MIDRMTFMDLEAPEYAYMFGFLQMDGHLHPGIGQKGRLSVELSHRDVDILREFQRLTPYYSRLTERTRATNFSTEYRSALWTVCSLEARTTLCELGLPYGSKSRSVKPPTAAFSEADYVRGVFDADGAVGFTGQGLPFISLTTASMAITEYLCAYGRRTIGAERTATRNRRDGVYNVMYMRENALELARALYYPGCLALERKQRAAAELQAWRRPADMKRRAPTRRWHAWEDVVLVRSDDLLTAAEELGRSEQSCAMRLWRFRTGRLPLPDEAAGRLA